MSRRRSKVIAADASMGGGRSVIAFADNTGSWAVASPYPATIHTGAAEATALVAAIDNTPANRGLHLLTDSMNTMHLLRTALAGKLTNEGPRFDIIRVLAGKARARAAPTVIHWVRGHDSTATGAAALHTTTDLLARTALRNVDAVFTDMALHAHRRTALHTTGNTLPLGTVCSCRWVPPHRENLHVITADDLTITIRPGKRKGVAV